MSEQPAATEPQRQQTATVEPCKGTEPAAEPQRPPQEEGLLCTICHMPSCWR